MLKSDFVSSKRREENLAPSLTVRENLFMNPALVERGGLRPIWRRGEIARSLAVLKQSPCDRWTANRRC